MSLKAKIDANPRLKKFIHWMLIPAGEARPRFWVKLLVNPFIHHKGKGAKVRDLWKHEAAAMDADGFKATVPSHGVVLLKISPR